MKIDRRRVLGLFGAGGVALGAESAAAQSNAAARFDHGVASGDPDQNSVVLWTRATPAGPDAGDVSLELEVAEDAAFAKVVHRFAGLRAGAARDYTVKHVAEGLKPATEYWFRFKAGTAVSPVGRTRTLPEAGVKDVVLAVVSCSLYPNGFFNTYRVIADLPRVDAVLHLGDYIYEYGAADGDYGMKNGRALNRIPEPAHEIVSLDDYRRRHAQYKTDPDLQAAHGRAPWIVVWDDHETANDSWTGGAENHQPETEGPWGARKAAALKAYHEWMPTRESDLSLPEKSYRSFRFGDVASLHMLESRLLARTKQLTYEDDLTFVPGPDGKPAPDVAAFRARLNDPSRRLLGDTQLAWLEGDLKASVAAGTAWQVIGNQIVMARVNGPDVDGAYGKSRVDAAMAKAKLGPYEAKVAAAFRTIFPHKMPLNLDAWDGYPAERERLYDVFKRTGAHPVVLAGDSHTFWVNELEDAAGRRVAVEFGGTAVSSPPPPYGPPFMGGRLPKLMEKQNREVKLCDAGLRGFMLVTLTREEAKGELIGVSTITERDFTTVSIGRFVSRRQAGGVGPIVRA